MTHKTLNELVREQILAEAPKRIREGEHGEAWVDGQLMVMDARQLLERISDAQRRASVMDIKNWI